MRIGIVADIHDAVNPLKRALTLLRQHGVEQVVTLGDAFETYLPHEPGADVAALLDEAGAVGVWGNHDLGLSYEVDGSVRGVADPGLLRFASRLRPQVVVAECRFSHIEPWKDPSNPVDLWLFDGIPNTVERAAKSFDAVPERILFVGHFHSWFAVTPHGTEDWHGTCPIDLHAPKRYLVSVGAVIDGCCALYDTAQSRLTPIRCSED